MLRNALTQILRRTLVHNHSHHYECSLPRKAVCSTSTIRYFSQEITSQWPESIKRFLERENITEPTKIQEKTFATAMANKDLVGVARTGSGKTLGFVIPAIIKIIQERGRGAELTNRMIGPSCLVLAPTRELAQQTAQVFDKFRGEGVNSIVLVGGSSRSAQIRELTRMQHDVYIATPGRLQDLIDDGSVSVSDVKYLVLDEADRMLDMGFEPQVRQILKEIPKENRQTLMWSATWPEEVQSIAKEFMRDYDYIAVDSGKLKANPNIKQIVEVCEPSAKIGLFLDYLQKFREEEEDYKTLVFVNTKRMADGLMMQLMRNRHKAVSMHGDRSQGQRESALRMFRERKNCILVATDVAARGLDISDITHVINYDFPTNVEDYVHRIGRTARHERKGTSLSFFTYNDVSRARKLIQVLEETNQPVPENLRALERNKHMYEQRQPVRRRRRDSFYGGRYDRSSQHSINYHNEDDYFDEERKFTDTRKSYLDVFK